MSPLFDRNLSLLRLRRMGSSRGCWRFRSRYDLRVLNFVAIEAWPPARHPIRSQIILSFQACTHQAVKAVLQRIEDNADVARPHNQVSRLRFFHSLKIFVPRVQFERAGIRVLETRIEIRLMYKVRAVL